MDNEELKRAVNISANLGFIQGLLLGLSFMEVLTDPQKNAVQEARKKTAEVFDIFNNVQ